MHPPQDKQFENDTTPESLLLLVYEELRLLAAKKLAGQGDAMMTLQATALVHEAWLRLSERGIGEWQDRAHFYRAAAMAMRNVLVDRVRQKLAMKRGGGLPVEMLEISQMGTFEEDHILLVDECLTELERTDSFCAKIVQLKFFAGLENAEVATMLGTSLRSVERHWTYARARLLALIRERSRDNAP
jgi:RNA polymerase sigma factor (TIGR02999 family)